LLGLRGNSYYHLAIQGSTKDLHSGVIGGSVHEAMTDLVRVMASLVDVDGKILIDGIYDDVMPLGEKEKDTYTNMEAPCGSRFEHPCC